MKSFLVSAVVQLLVFGVLGSVLLTGTTMALLTFAFWDENPSINLFREMGQILLIVVPSAAIYTCGIGLVDFVLRWLAVPYRMVTCGLIATGSLMALIWMTGNTEQPLKLTGICLIAAATAVLCSWLCNFLANRKLPPAGLLALPPVSTASPG